MPDPLQHMHTAMSVMAWMGQNQQWPVTERDIVRGILGFDLDHKQIAIKRIQVCIWSLVKGQWLIESRGPDGQTYYILPSQNYSPQYTVDASDDLPF